MGAHYSHALTRFEVAPKKMIVSLWDFASECYRRPGVAEVCLHAQDRYEADVNMLLSASWLASRGSQWRDADVLGLVGMCTEWRLNCLLPLREVRRYLNRVGTPDMYAHSKALELEAEHHQLELMEAVLLDLPSNSLPPAEALQKNIIIYLGTLPASGSSDIDLANQLATLIAPSC